MERGERQQATGNGGIKIAELKEWNVKSESKTGKELNQG
jgi:hypothetical protein